ncbi:MAG: glycosyltransferase family 4 protein [Aequorivita sp.]
MSNLKILQIGPHSYVGGVSIHIKRLTKILNEDFEFSYIDESPANISPPKKLNVRRILDHQKIWSTIRKQDIIHIHSGNWLLRLYFIFVSFLLRKPIIVTLHSYRLNGYKAKVTERFLSRPKLIIAVSKEIKRKLSLSLKEKTIIKEAFIPPNMQDEPVLSQEVLEVLRRVDYQNKFLISANAYRLTKFNNRELYGLDQCIDIAELAKKNKLKLHIVFIVGTLGVDDTEYYESFINLINTHKLDSYITIIPKRISFVRLIQHSNLVLRPTLSDGDAITIREALFLGKRVIASDVVKRPDNVVLYKTGNVNDLYSKIEKVIHDNSKVNSNLIEKNNCKKQYTEIYNQCNN